MPYFYEKTIFGWVPEFSRKSPGNLPDQKLVSGIVGFGIFGIFGICGSGFLVHLTRKQPIVFHPGGTKFFPPVAETLIDTNREHNSFIGGTQCWSILLPL